MSYEQPWLIGTLAAAAVLVVLPLLVVWRKGRAFAPGDVFRASRWSGGNRLFPTQVLVTPEAVVHFTPRWMGRHEASIHIAHISSVKIDTGMLLSDVLIETSGGANPVRCHGHRKRDAVTIKTLIERYQTAYYQAAPPPASRTR